MTLGSSKNRLGHSYIFLLIQNYLSDDFIMIIIYRPSRLESPALLVQLPSLRLDLLAKTDASIMVVADRLVHRLQSAGCVENQLLGQH